MPTVRIEPSGFEAHLNPGEPVLAGLFRCGYTVRQVGCRRGGCGICKIELTAGEVTYEKVVAESVLTAQEQTQGTCLTCRAIPVGDITLHLEQVDVHQAPPGLLRYLNVAAHPAVTPASTPGPATTPASTTHGFAATNKE
ncbi:MAG TPA: 2Fe-2S iron-sulfur cluster-binding protein [Nocardioides sp.]|uniref:2Fe-2S iron-sulfur cluster-binding protein n=1 Tax=Nocardioides sp. TaxID=35761 RepID=UPI002B7FB69A|nr:2Fe-2S iron-sulfur cluster-binding protein [Nocardioides sp.]HQR27733.1 2Fe-2S iron-sulfur cluster-binding protein [Nocardioides sp.]